MNEALDVKSKPSHSEVEAPEASTVGRLARSGAMWSVVMHVGRQVISLVGTVIVSRILSPSDYGLIAMVATFTALLQTFSDFGLSWATIQRRNISTPQVHNLFWLNAVFGLLLWLSCIVAAPALAAFYGRSELGMVTVVLGASFAFAGFAAQPTALIKRAMHLKKFSMIVIASTLIGVCAGVAVAMFGGGYWALVVQIVVTQFFRSVLTFLGSGYRPGLPRRNVDTLVLVRFGGYMAVTGTLLFFARSFDNVLIGKTLGSEELGYYSRAYFIVSLPAIFATTIMSNVMVPSLSALADDRARMASAYRRALGFSAVVGFPASLGLAVLAPAAVRLIYGDSWQPVVPLLIWLSIAGLFQPVYETASWLFVSNGKSRSYFSWSLLGAVSLMVGFTIGIRWGTLGVAIASSILWPLIMSAPSLVAAHKAAGLDIRPSLVTVRVPLIASLVMAAAVWLTGKWLGLFNMNWLLVTAFQIAAGITLYVCMLIRFWEPFPPAILSRFGLLRLKKEND
jgi:PST family polysaccharide transporter